MRKTLIKIKNGFLGLDIFDKLWIIFVIIILITALFVLFYEIKNKKEEADIERIKEAIRMIESEEPPRITEDMTEEDLYNNDYIKQIRKGLDAYVSGSNIGVEEFTIMKNDLGGQICGLEAFDKAYYKSKFILIGAGDNDYGGVEANLFFIDKPDKLFWAWVYRLGGDGEYVLRGFCESDLTQNLQATEEELNDFIKGMIEESKYSL